VRQGEERGSVKVINAERAAQAGFQSDPVETQEICNQVVPVVENPDDLGFPL